MSIEIGPSLLEFNRKFNQIIVLWIYKEASGLNMNIFFTNNNDLN